MPLQDLHVTQRLVTVRLTRGEHLVKTAEKEKCHYDLVALDPASEAFNCLDPFLRIPGLANPLTLSQPLWPLQGSVLHWQELCQSKKAIKHLNSLQRLRIPKQVTNSGSYTLTIVVRLTGWTLDWSRIFPE